MSLFAFRQYEFPSCFFAFALPTRYLSAFSPFAILVSLLFPDFSRRRARSAPCVVFLCLAWLLVSRLAGAFGDSEKSEDGAGLRFLSGLGAFVSASVEAFGELRMDQADGLDWLIDLSFMDGFMD